MLISFNEYFEIKEYSSKLLNALFNKMLIDSEIDKRIYDKMKETYFLDVENYYRTMFNYGIEKESNEDIKREVEEIVKGMELKEQHEAIEVDKMIKHSIQIIESGRFDYDVIVNILYGSIETGLNLKSVSKLLYNKPISADIFFCRFSRYDEKDKFVKIPKQLENDIPKNKKVIIMDDSTGTGITLRKTRDFFKKFNDLVDITATEISYKYILDVATGKKKGEVINLNELVFESFIPYRKRD